MKRWYRLAWVLMLAAYLMGGAAWAWNGTSSAMYTYLPNRSVNFYDVDESYHWAFREIDALALHGILQGGHDHLFYPDRAITRAEFMVMLDRTYDMSEALAQGGVQKPTGFSDVQPTDYYAQSVEAAQAFGIAQGAHGKFEPMEVLTRQDAMVLLGRTLDKTAITLGTGAIYRFEDADQVAEYAREAMGALVSAGVVSGTQGQLRPTASLTRAQAAVMLYRASHLTSSEGNYLYEKRSDVVNLCIGDRVYSDVVIENYTPGTEYRALMRYTSFRQTGDTAYITLAEQQAIDQRAVYTAGQLRMANGAVYPLAPHCIAVDVTDPYHSLRAPQSTGGQFEYCMPSIEDGMVTVIYYYN